jgi:hypothetical protein
MRVYRVAHRTVRNSSGGYPAGPYHTSNYGDDRAARDVMWELGNAHCDSMHPSPYADGELQTIYAGEICGFDQRCHLDMWMGEWRQKLKDVGFCVYVYEVPEARVGWYGQALFKINDATLVETQVLI